MPPATAAELVEVLRRNKVLDPEQLAKISGGFSRRFADARALARTLIDRNWLTPYQVNQMFLDNGQELVLGQYVLLERLGEGGMGQVFKARHRSLGRIVALKIIRKERLTRPDVVRRFLREVQAAAQLKHPNVVLAFDADQIGNTHFIAMEYVEGIDLSRLVKTSGPLPVEQAAELICQAAMGLEHARTQGLVHRDIKPANLFVTRLPPPGAKPLPKPSGRPMGFLTEQSGSISGAARGPQVKILDMGLARLNPAMESDTTTGVTQEGVVVGTVDFLAPEQAMNASTVDIRADIYSLGCTFYYLLTGQVPFSGTSAMEKLLKHRCEEPPPVEQVRPEVSPALAAVVRKLMAKRPEDRYQTPADVALAIAALAAADALARTTPAVTLPPALPASGSTVRDAVPMAIRVNEAELSRAEVPPAAILIGPSGPWEGIADDPASASSKGAAQPPWSSTRSRLISVVIAVSLVAGAILLVYLVLRNAWIF
jgi:serine/threonine-protein kinase